MPGIYLSDPLPTATDTNSQTRDIPDAPAITSVAVPGDFELGIDTCGFTYESTVTCSSGSQCTNVGSYRGCCISSGEDCISTMYTTCLDYGLAPVPEDCGDHTLCCPALMPSCFSYGYISTMSDDRPDATLTHVQCHRSAGFGEMFPFPPELFTSMTDAGPSPHANATDIEVQPIDDDGDGDSSSSSSSTGVIVGAAIGVVALLLLIAIALFLIVRRRRQKKAELEAAASTMALPPRDKESGDGAGDAAAADDDDGGGGGGQKPKQRLALGLGRLRPLSTIQEQPSPITTRPLSTAGGAAATSAPRRKSLRRTFGPHWPLGSGNPLASHPVDLESRLSDPRTSTDTGTGTGNAKVPQLQLSPLAGSKLASSPLSSSSSSPPPPPPPPKSPYAAIAPASASTSQPQTPTSISAGLQSPRLNYVPVSPIDAAFDKRFDGGGSSKGGGSGSGSGSGSGVGGLGIGVAISRSLSSRSARSIGDVTGTSTSRRTSTPASYNRHQQQQQQQQQQDQADPVSPIDDEDEDEVTIGEGEGERGEDDDADSKRLSFVSAPSIAGDGGDDDLVSPISPEFDRRPGAGGPADERAVSPATVSPVESRRGSLAGPQS
ncbi:hypothetical protein SLS62_008584 [Diatrype stigma]|uniref:Uncharacterized protein n=1 Tax=Diatrype stigma TaxID=117547 RepID=A0AAN9YKD2_9PEZI